MDLRASGDLDYTRPAAQSHFIFCFCVSYILSQVSSYFSCLGECFISVLLWSSRNVLRTTTNSADSPSAWREETMLHCCCLFFPFSIVPADMLVSSVSPVSSFITFCSLSHEFVVYNWTCLPVDVLGDRLEAAEDAQLQAQACLCYICAGNVEKLVSCWTRAQDGRCPLSLQVLQSCND